MGVSYPGGKSPDKAARAWGAMMRRSENLTPAMKVGAEAVERLIKLSFNNSTSPAGVSWEGLKESTIRNRRRGSSMPLQDSGALKLFSIATHGARSIMFGTNIPYAGFHQFGTIRIPPRPFLPISISGELTMQGPAKVVFDRIFQSVGNYIVNGKLVR